VQSSRIFVVWVDSFVFTLRVCLYDFLFSLALRIAAFLSLMVSVGAIGFLYTVSSFVAAFPTTVSLLSVKFFFPFPM